MSKIFNNALFEAKERESAVSPVVGVMLMLVVTIIIAATVSAFAGGLVGTSDKAPQAALDVKADIVHNSMGDYVAMVFTHLGGDPIDTSKTKLVTLWTNRTTNEAYYRETTALPASKTPQEFLSGYYVNLSLVDANVNTTSYKYQEPYLVVPQVYPAATYSGLDPDTSLWYGNFILKPGDVMKEHMSVNVGTYGNTNGYKEHSVIKEGMLLSTKDVVNVKLIDMPTGQIIFNKDVYVTEG